MQCLYYVKSATSTEEDANKVSGIFKYFNNYHWLLVMKMMITIKYRKQENDGRRLWKTK